MINSFDCKKHGPPFGTHMGTLCGECEKPIRKLPNGVAVHERLSYGDRKNISDLQDVQKRYPDSWLAKQRIE